MKKIFAIAAAACMVMLGLGVSMPAQAAESSASVSQSAQLAYHYTGKRFNSRYICVQNNIGQLWNIDGADNWFESGVNTVILNDRFPAWGDPACSVHYVGSQIITVGTYNDGSSNCFEVNAYSLNGKYTQPVGIGMNVSAASAGCRDTAQHRNNNISEALGSALGLALFTDYFNFTACIMNEYYSNLYNYAGTDDRNALYYLY